MERLQWTEEAARLVVDAAPESDVSAVLWFCGVASLIFWVAGQRSGHPNPLWMAPLGIMALRLLSLTRRERCEFSAQGCRIQRTTLGLGGTRSFEAAQIRALRAEPMDAPASLVFEDRKTGDMVRIAYFNGTTDQGLIGLLAKITERFPAYAEVADPLPFSSGYRLTEEDSCLTLTLQLTPLPVGVRLWMLGLCLAVVGIGGVRDAISHLANLVAGPDASTYVLFVCALVALLIVFSFVMESRRKRITFDQDGCTLSSKIWGLGAMPMK